MDAQSLPMVVVATKFDELYREIHEDADHVYNSHKARDAIKAISSYLGIEKSHVFPIVNYVDDQIVKCGKDRLALQALDVMVRLINDHLENRRALNYGLDDWLKRATKFHIPTTEEEKRDLLLKVEAELTGLDNQIRVLCVGAVNSGKTSFIDSVASTLEGQIVYMASGGLTTSYKRDSLESVTNKTFQIKYKIESGEIKRSNVYIGDTPGFQTTAGIRLEDVQYVVRGHVPNKYSIQNGITRNSETFKKKPKKSDKVHCVCLVFDISMCPDDLPENVRITLQSLPRWLVKRAVPFVVILTKCDWVCDEVRTSPLSVFEDEAIKERMNKLRRMFGFKQKKIFPVINYIHEEEVDPEADALLMDVFWEILKLGKEYLNNDDEDSDESDEEQVPGASP